MPRLRPDLESLHPYRPGRTAAEVAATYGVTDVVKIASNEVADAPSSAIVAAVAKAAATVNRYPDNARGDLLAALGTHLGVPPTHVWAGGASNELGTLLAVAFGGPGTSIVYAWPSFSLYPIATRTSGSDAIEVPVDAAHRHDLDAMLSAIRDDTTVVFVCNPNNPTGTHVPFSDLVGFIDSLDPGVLVIVDEAYHEFATAADHASAVPLAATRPNVAVTRTFSKAFGLAGLRVGYVVADPEVLDGIRRIQIPFTVTSPAMAGAIEALKHPNEVTERVARIVAGRDLLTREMQERGFAVAPSEANFVYVDLGDRVDEIVEGLLHQGVIVRVVPPVGFVRISIGSPSDTERLLEALDVVVS